MEAQPRTVERAFVRLNEGRPLRVHAIAAQSPVARHGHHFHEIILVTGGSAEHVTDLETVALRPGMAIVVAPGQQHSYRMCRNLAIINIYYLAEWFLADVHALRSADFLIPVFFASNLYNLPARNRIMHTTLTEEEQARCLAELREIGEREHPDPASLLYCEACFLKFLLILGEAATRENETSFLPPFRREIQKGIEEIEKQVTTHGDFSVERTARRAGMSPDHFARLFKNSTGFAPMEYYQRHRIHHVCRSLLNSKAGITELAHSFGYADATHLNRYFKRYLGVTPSAYRREAGKISAGNKTYGENSS